MRFLLTLMLVGIFCFSAEAKLKINNVTSGFAEGYSWNGPSRLVTEAIPGHVGGNIEASVHLKVGEATVVYSESALKKAGYSIAEFQNLISNAIKEDEIEVRVRSASTNGNAEGVQYVLTPIIEVENL